MKKNLYFRTVMTRHNVIARAILDFILKIASYPRLLIEVFLRKNFGERYFATASVISVATLMIAFALFWTKIFPRIGGFSSYAEYSAYEKSKDAWFRWEFATWYIFIVAFIYVSYQRRKEVKRNPSVFDFARFSLYTGDIHPKFWNLKVFGKKPTARQIETLYEPLLPFVIGVILWLIEQKLGIVLVVSSICYSLSYVQAYRQGDHFVMDKIDEMIMNEEMQSAFIEDESSNNTRGVRFYAERPRSKADREKLREAIVVDDNSETVFAT